MYILPSYLRTYVQYLHLYMTLCTVHVCYTCVHKAVAETKYIHSYLYSTKGFMIDMYLVHATFSPSVADSYVCTSTYSVRLIVKFN